MRNDDILDLESINEQGDYYNKPNLMLRVKSMVIDSFVIIVLMYASSFLLGLLNIESGNVRGVALGLIFLYEPIMTSMHRTVGQKLMGLRVRKYKAYKNNMVVNISIFSALIRYVFKLLLGWISLLTIHSDTYGQAIHDKIGNSLMTIER